MEKMISAFLCMMLLTGCVPPVNEPAESPAAAITTEAVPAASPSPSAAPITEKHADWIIYSYDEDGNWLSTSIEGIEYMSQLDPRWNNEVIGDGKSIGIAGCAVTDGAMMLTRLTGNEVTPYEVASIFHEWGYYNNQYSGTMPDVWQKAADYWNLDYRDNLSEEEMEEALRDGWIIIASVQGGSFTRIPESMRDWVSHAILIYSLDSEGNTNVLDPYRNSNNHSFKASDLYALKISFYDNGFGGGFYAFADE